MQELGVVVGQRVRELRMKAGATQDDLARACRRMGLSDWRSSRVNHVEAGKAGMQLLTLYALAVALTDLTGEPVRLSDLIPPDGLFSPGGTLTIGADDLRAALQGGAPRRRFSTVPHAEDTPGWGNADDTAAAELDADPWAVLTAARELWGPQATVTTERDRRAGTGATPQKRGRITRALITEMRETVDRLQAESAEA